MIVGSGSLSSSLALGLRTLAVTATVLIATPLKAADLPVLTGGRPALRAFGPRLLPPHAEVDALLPEQVFLVPSRFDIYGYPVRGPVFVAPEPLYASTGCPAALQPVYDSVGNFSGYAAAQICR